MSSSDEDDCKVATTSAGGERVDSPNPNDVLCGRGGNINSHTGNEQFRKLVEKRKRVYLTARFKREKRLIASSIVNEIRGMEPPGRFLARKGSMKDGDGYWYDIGDEKARDKTSQALRENAPSIRAEIETEINQQRAEMRRQETPSPSSAAKKEAPTPPYPPPPHGHHHAGHHGHPPPPPPPHAYNPSHQSHYTQQYYDYYYHYYGYGAPPPPPPPGYAANASHPPAGAPPPAGYPPQPPPYWAAPTSPTNTSPGGSPPAPQHPLHPTATSVIAPSPALSTDVKPPPVAAMSGDPAHPHHASHAPSVTQEEEDHRLAMALQQEENAKAFEDRNRRFGSDRRSSRSTAYCAPGYRPRLLNDSVESPNQTHGSTPTRKKRPPMSASHFFGPLSHQRERANTSSGNSLNNTVSGASNDNDTVAEMEHDDHFEMDLKPPAMDKHLGTSNNDGMEHGHSDHNDFSCSSFSSRGRMNFKDDSDVISLFGEGGTIIPPSNANSTGSFSRMRNAFATATSTTPSNHDANHTGNHHFNPIALDQQQQQQRSGSRPHGNDNHHHGKQQNHQDSSLLSQVAHHILGNFGGGGSSWSDSNHNTNSSSNKKQEHHHQNDNDGAEMEMEIGQEVIMDVRDESSSMPPPQSRGSGTTIDWPSRAGCHTWIPDSMVDSTTRSSHRFGPDDNHRDSNPNPANDHHHSHHSANDHSLTRQSSYSRADISPINSMDMEFSRSSYMGVRHRANNNNGGNNSTGSSSLMNIFDQKSVDPNPEELLSQIHRSALQQVPSWERSYRSRSSISLGEMSGIDEMENSLIRVKSRDIKDKLFGVIGSNNHATQPSVSSGQHNHEHHHHPQQQQPLHPRHHYQNTNHQGEQPQQPMKPSEINGHHMHHQDHHHQAPVSSQPHESRGMNMDWD